MSSIPKPTQSVRQRAEWVRTLPAGSYRELLANAVHQYFLKVVPTSFAPLKGQTLSTHQYSVTESTSKAGGGSRLQGANPVSCGGHGYSLVPPYTCGSASLPPSPTGARAKVWCLLIYAEASLSLSLPQGPGLKPGASIYMRKRLSPSLRTQSPV